MLNIRWFVVVVVVVVGDRDKRTILVRRCEKRVDAYRFAHLLLPLQHVGHGVVAGKLHVAVEDHALAQDRRDVRRVVVMDPTSWKKGVPN